MRALMGLIKDRHGTYYAQKRVPNRLQQAVARVRGHDKPRLVFLKTSLGTKNLKDANVRAKLVLADFDRTLAQAEALIKEPKTPARLRTTLNDAEIKRMAEYVYAKALAWDERVRFGRDEFKRMEKEHLRLEGRPFNGPWAIPYEKLPAHGMSPAQLEEQRRQLDEELRHMRECLALGDISAVEDHIIEALDAFQIDLDRQGTAYPKLGIEILRAYVRALQAIEQRNAGEPVPTPQLVSLPTSAALGNLREAFEGWKKERERPEGTVHEYGRAIEMFIQLHGNLSILEIKRSHARTFREALQLVPRSRKGALLKASLPELSDYGRAHPTVQKVSPGTVNKQLGAVQAIAGWGRHNGLVPEDAPWSDPFEEMRLEEEQSQREPFDARDLQIIFNAPLFTEHKLPLGAKGERIAQANADLPSAMRDADLRLVRSSSFLVPGKRSEGLKFENARINEEFQASVNELNTRFIQARAPLNYHNGFIQMSVDALATSTIETPFWNMVASPKWKNVDLDMKEALDRRDSGGRDPAFHAVRALESAIKIVCDEKGWTHGKERGAHNYIDNLSSNGFLADWEAMALKQLFTAVRNPLGHGPGSAAMPILTQAQTDWAIDTSMSWVKRLVRSA